MTAAEWVGILGAVAGVSGGGIALFKAKPEAKKINADAAKTLVDASASIVQGVEKELASLRSKVEKLEEHARERGQRDDLQDRRLLVHERWDQKVADKLRDLGAPVEDPPPLYPATG